MGIRNCVYDVMGTIRICKNQAGKIGYILREVRCDDFYVWQNHRDSTLQLCLTLSITAMT